MSTLKPEKLSQPFAISGGWNAGDPWPIVHVSSLENMSNAWHNEKETKLQIEMKYLMFWKSATFVHFEKQVYLVRSTIRISLLNQMTSDLGICEDYI